MNREPVARYRRFIEANWLHGQVTVGAQLLTEAHERIDQDYARGFLPADAVPGAELDVSVRMRAPMTPGRYRLEFDVVSEYVCWFADNGSVPASLSFSVR